jgi:hypothetical protein
VSSAQSMSSERSNSSTIGVHLPVFCNIQIFRHGALKFLYA